MSWKKSRGGLCYTWVGYELSLRDWTLGVSASRAGWIRSWYERTLKTRTVDTGELREVLGRIQFVYGALVYDRHFLAPLYTFLALHPPGVVKRLPLYALITVYFNDLL